MLQQYNKIADSIVAVASSESPFINHLKSQPSESTSSNPLNSSLESPDIRRYKSDMNRQNYPQNTQTCVSLRDRTFQSRFDVRPFFADQRQKYATRIYSTLTEPDLANAGVNGQEIKLR